MKRHNDSLYWQNMQLYAWGVLVNGLGLSFADARGGFRVRTHLASSASMGLAWRVATQCSGGVAQCRW